MESNLQKEASIEQAIDLGLRTDEFDQIKEILGRTPNFTETAVYSVMWSEHCSYKNSILWLKKIHFGKSFTYLFPLGHWVKCKAIFKTFIQHEIALRRRRELLP